MEKMAPRQRIRQRIYDGLDHGMDEAEGEITTAMVMILGLVLLFTAYGVSVGFQRLPLR